MHAKGMLNSMVFSTYVEVIPSGLYPASLITGILHVCGGDPKVDICEMRER